MKELTQTQAQLGGETQQSQKGGGDMDMEALANQFIEYLMESFYDVEKEKRPRNLAKGFLVWADTVPARSRGWFASILDTFLGGLDEWDKLEDEERKWMVGYIFRRLHTLANEEEDWAGLSEEEWVELLKKKLVSEKIIEDDDAAFWKWIKGRIEEEDMYELLDWAFEGNVDWEWMLQREKRELAEAMEEFIIEKLKSLKS